MVGGSNQTPMTDGDKGIQGEVSLRHLKPRTARGWLGSSHRAGAGGPACQRENKGSEKEENAAKVWGLSCWGVRGEQACGCTRKTRQAPKQRRSPPKLITFFLLQGKRVFLTSKQPSAEGTAWSPFPRGTGSCSNSRLVEKTRQVNSEHPSAPDSQQERCGTPHRGTGINIWAQQTGSHPLKGAGLVEEG